jgi:uncharacterized protein YndB with AHSA1/START domain
MTVLAVTDKRIIREASVNRSIDDVWTFWTTEEGMKAFLMIGSKIDLRPFGAYELYFAPDAKPGDRGGEGNVVLSFIPGKMLSFTWNAPPSIAETRDHPHKTWVVLSFTPVGPDRTDVTLTHLGWPEGEAWEKTYAYFERAWTSVMDRLSHM